MVTGVRLCPASQAPPGESVVVEYGGEEYALFNTGEHYFAVTNRCPHEGAPLIGCPVIKDAAVCLLHGWRVALAPRSDGGKHADGLTRLKVFERQGHLYAEVP